MNVKENQNILFILPAVFSILAIIALALWGLKPGIDIAGGSMLQVSYDTPPSIEAVNQKVSGLDLGEVRVQASGDKDFILRQKELNAADKQKLMNALGTLGTVHEVQFNSIGPSIGAEIVQKS